MYSSLAFYEDIVSTLLYRFTYRPLFPLSLANAAILQLMTRTRSSVYEGYAFILIIHATIFLRYTDSFYYKIKAAMAARSV